MITELKEMMIERIQAFRAKSNSLPARIIVYRDGVSEVCSVACKANIFGLTIDSTRVNS